MEAPCGRMRGDRMTSPKPIPPAVILAAGRGNRLLPLTERIPKCLLEVGGRTILEHQVAALGRAGVTRIQVVTGHGAEHVRATCDRAVDYAHNAQFDRTTSFDSFACASVEIGAAGLLVLNSDVLFHPDLLDRLIADERENVLLADFDVELGEEEMKIVVDERRRIAHISKTIEPRQAHAENLGVLKLGPDAAHRMTELGGATEEGPKILWVPDAIHHLRDEFDFFALPTDGAPWIEIDYPHDLERARTVVHPRIQGALEGSP